MALRPSKSYLKKGIRIKEYEIEKVSLSSAAPYISIFFLPPLPSKRIGIAAENIIRECVNGRIKFISDYYVDSKVIWTTTPQRQSKIAITLCECGAPALQKLLKLLQELYQKHSFTQHNMKFYFKNEAAETYIRENLLKFGCDYPVVLEEVLQEESIVAADCSFEVLQLDEWTSNPVKAYPIESIKITTPSPIKYRVHYYKSNWGAWVENGIETRRGQIDGFQFIYEGKDNFLYRCGFKNKPTTKWYNKNLPMPFKIPITQFECKIE